MRRQIRRDRGKIDDTIDVVTDDGYFIRIKPFIVSRSRIKEVKNKNQNSGKKCGDQVLFCRYLDCGTEGPDGWFTGRECK